MLNEKENCKFYSGLPDKSVFDVMLKHIATRLEKPKKEFKKINQEEKFLIVLMKIRLNLKNKLLADIFDVSEGFISKLFLRWMPHVAKTFSYLIEWPTKQSVNTQKPTNQEAQTLVFSSYKNNQTNKFLVAIAPNGSIIFISDAWGGHSSDKEITLKSGLLKLLKPYDVVLADKGFLVQDELIKMKVKFVMPSFKSSESQLTSAEVMHSQNVSNLRIHVERVIGPIRNFKMLNDIVITRSFKTINYIVQTCCGIVNLNPPIVH
ncbi:hypothetical protein B566_EDAN013411 [Ephemera danica]|nr:hypothetical protein B566_EDAN013411 [Ephemera danica]